MTPPEGEEPWRLLDNATWRAGYNLGARYPSVMLTFKGEALDAAELAVL